MDDELLTEYGKEIQERIRCWKHINESGSNDPGWPDGVNMNLVRNHVLYYKRKIMEICETNNWELPGEFYLPTPPLVKQNYMANLNQKERVERLRGYGYQLQTRKQNFDDAQTSIL